MAVSVQYVTDMEIIHTTGEGQFFFSDKLNTGSMEDLSHFKSEAATKAESETRGVQLQPLHQIPLYPTHWTFHTNVRSWDWM